MSLFMTIESNKWEMNISSRENSICFKLKEIVDVYRAHLCTSISKQNNWFNGIWLLPFDPSYNTFKSTIELYATYSSMDLQWRQLPGKRKIKKILQIYTKCTLITISLADLFVSQYSTHHVSQISLGWNPRWIIF